ncbi:hypothetical protein EVAR_82920_1 [Eumeta japonica]|uniref:Uncharacterized protein n=1 Tax=Eumeta variegata TaxID=151549 RepID=A0A4C1X0B6_EUMVA|nr:hypothetical protein EVAR_82920_1 [Eumeta japonica]
MKRRNSTGFGSLLDPEAVPALLPVVFSSPCAPKKCTRLMVRVLRTDSKRVTEVMPHCILDQYFTFDPKKSGRLSAPAKPTEKGCRAGGTRAA